MLKKALFVGIDEYNSRSANIKNLQGCVADMQLMKETLKKALGNLPGDTTTLVNNQATTRNVLNSLHHLVADIKPGEQVLMYFAGHGGRVPNLFPDKNDPEPVDEVLVTHDFSKTEPLLDDILHSYINKIPQNSRFILIFDNCHAGGMPRAPMSMAEMDIYLKEGWESRNITPVTKPDYSPTEMQKLAQHQQRYKQEKSKGQFIFLAAAQPHESAYERYFGKNKHGIFTYYICERIREKGINISPVDLINYSHAKIETHRSDQMPRLIGSEHFFNRQLFEI